jgi:hypothetical protein
VQLLAVTGINNRNEVSPALSFKLDEFKSPNYFDEPIGILIFKDCQLIRKQIISQQHTSKETTSSAPYI